MTTVLLILQVFIVVLLAIIILLQKSKSDSLISSGGLNNYISQKTYSSFISKFTLVLAFIFMANSLFLAKIEVDKNLELKSFIKSLSNEEIPNQVDSKFVDEIEVPKTE